MLLSIISPAAIAKASSNVTTIHGNGVTYTMRIKKNGDKVTCIITSSSDKSVKTTITYVNDVLTIKNVDPKNKANNFTITEELGYKISVQEKT